MNDPDRLYRLLPAIYRERDDAEGKCLQALLRLVCGQADLLRADIQQLWDNFFIETCERWAISYIGDLVANNLLHDTSRIRSVDTAHALFPDLQGRDLRPPIAIRIRADVAKTIYYRRRKGTLPMLEELARDVTGWSVRAVELFELLIWNQYVKNHLRMLSTGTPDIRHVETVDRLNGPFDSFSHTVDVRLIEPLTGWYNIKNIGFFVWRLGSYPLANVRARLAGVSWGFHFSPLGNPAPLFSRWRREGDEADLATELHVGGPIRKAFFYEDLQRYRNLVPPRTQLTDLYGEFDVVAPETSLFILRNGVPVGPALDPSADVNAFTPQILCGRLKPWPATQPSGQVITVDVESGRLAVGTGWASATTTIDVFYHYGFSADLGGGPYERGKWLVRPELAVLRLQVQENGLTPGSFTSLAAAFAEWISQGKPDTIITILDSRTYAEVLAIDLAAGGWLVVEAANGQRPHIIPTGGEIMIGSDGPGSELTLNGLLIEGAVHVTGDVRLVRLLHATLVPGRALDEEGDSATSEPSLIVEASLNNVPINAGLRIQMAFSITGPLRIPEHGDGLWLFDSIVDGVGETALCATGTVDGPAAPLTMERVTIFGPSFCKKILLASETLFAAPVTAIQRQEGCVRFSFVPAGSATPRRYRCQPDLEIASQIEESEKKAQANNTTLTPQQRAAIRAEVRNWLVPSFTSNKYGEPAYAQLHLSCPTQLKTGAEDGAEIGVFCHLKQPQRETNLRIRLDEYLPFGLDPGIMYVT